MFIQEIIIDGFKSYSQKTVLSGFDPQFNAITGLNGSGKSNILDSICFVLGISNLTQVRVGNLQELVYKQGQAGVTKASVTIIFNNSDVSGSPVGYESHKQITVTRQIVIGGKNKYMINGHTVQQSQVQNLFHSVQLNVNNPHFLIMQGRITKVLNMKPPEILAMIEEAAGTRMFETKKQAALKTIEKKQLKVDEITQCINEEITPTLESLRTERKNYQTWQANNTECERLERLCAAYEYCEAENKVHASESDRQKLVDEQNAYLQATTDKQQAADECSKQITEIEKVRNAGMESELEELKKTENEVSKELVKVNAHYTNQKDNLKSETEARSSLSEQLESTNKSFQEKEIELKYCMDVLEAKEKEYITAEDGFKKVKENYQNACAGVADESNAALLSLPEQIGVWEKSEREAQSSLKQCEQKSQHLQNQIKESKKLNKTQSAAHATLAKEADDLKKTIEMRERDMAKLKFTEADENKGRAREQELRSELTTHTDESDSLKASVQARLNFDYKDPERGFDRSRVKGLVANLFKIRDSSVATALEITAGAKLSQVVVDSEVTGKLLLQQGGLKKRVTLLPLNKISHNCVDPERINRAKAIAMKMGGTANLALELVEFHKDVRNAIEHVFGNTIVCNTAAIASAIAYDKSIRVKTVTLEGDVYDPAGTLTGGSNNQIGSLLRKMDELSQVTAILDRKSAELAAIRSNLATMEKDVARAKEIAVDLDLKRHALRICEEKLADSSYSQSAAEIADMEAQLVSLDEDVKKAHEQVKKAKAELAKLKAAEGDMKKHRENAMKDIENEMKKSQKALNTLKTELQNLRNKKDSIQAELNALSKDLETLKEQLITSETSFNKQNADIEALEAKVNDLKAVYEAAKLATTDKQKELNLSSKEVKALKANREKLLKESQNAALEARKLTHKVKQWDKETADAAKALQALLKVHPWIEKEKSFFGKEGSDFDFAAKDMETCTARLKEVKADQDRLSKKINKKVMGMIENAESEYAELTRKREVILNDKAKIETVISELDVKKIQSLQATWVKVNKDFGSIFSMLLPGTHAKLEPPEGGSVTDGLEVKVAFNNVWKDSLTELSGGQRSLLALSLILSMLLFKPAPMYILDEVDAALDLSHTQNIGMMLRTHFSSSQFIVVSLKEGMFNNANVIFRTRFVDGISAVSRTVAGPQRNNKAITNTDNEETVEDAPQKKRGKNVSKAIPASTTAAMIDI